MRILLASDGSEDGLDALEQVALLCASGPHEAVTIVVGWPPREGELWRSAFERQAIVDDLHRAVEETVERISERLHRIAATMAHAVRSRTEDGDAAEQLAVAAELERIDLLIVGVTGGPGRRHAHAVLDELRSRFHKPSLSRTVTSARRTGRNDSPSKTEQWRRKRPRVPIRSAIRAHPGSGG